MDHIHSLDPLYHRAVKAKTYLVGIGSNIEPTVNVPLAMNRLLDRASRCVLSRAIQTEPVGMLSNHPFLNLVVYLEIDLEPRPFKTFLTGIEVALGRDRNDPQRKVKDRPIDLDILTEINSYEDGINVMVEAPQYYRAILFELLTTLSHDLSDLDPATIPLQIGNISCGHRPTPLLQPLSSQPYLMAHHRL